MAQQIINVGTAPNDGTGDTLKTSFTKTNANFSELYTRPPGNAYVGSGTVPSSPNAGDLWYDLTTGSLSIYINDGNSSQWVAILPGGGALTLGSVHSGRLAFVSATQLSFLPFNGNAIKINGSVLVIPSTGNGIAGLTNTGVYVNGVAAQSLATDTTYYVYAFNNAGVVTADFSVVGHATSVTGNNAGTEIKTGDETRTLIGMVRHLAGGFADNAASRLVRSWFNRSRQMASIFFPAAFTTNAITMTPIAGTLVQFLMWVDEPPLMSITGYVNQNGNSHCSSQGLVDGVLRNPVSRHYATTAGDNESFGFITDSNEVVMTEGYHTYQFAMASSSASWTASANVVVSVVVG